MQGADIWTTITQMPRAHKLVDFPRKGADGNPVCSIAIMVLTQEDQNTAMSETERYTRRIIKEVPKDGEARRGYEDIYNNRAACEILFRACRRVDDPRSSFFPVPDAIEKHLTPDEVAVLFRAYLEVQAQFGPILSRLSEEEVEGWVKRLREAGNRVPLAFLSLDALSDLAFSLACRIGRSATDTSSPGSPPDEPHESTGKPAETTEG